MIHTDTDTGISMGMVPIPIPGIFTNIGIGTIPIRERASIIYAGFPNSGRPP